MGSNAKSGSAAKITLEKFDDLFGGSAAQGSGAEQIINAPLAELYTFKDHPFRVEDDEKMEETTESIRQYGVLVPGIARPRAGGGYEIIAGHRRKRGSELAGKTEMPVIVRNYTDDEATIIMVDVMMMEGDDGTGKEPFAMTDVLFCYPACKIGCEIRELFSDNFVLCLESEIWILENGEFASVYCVSIGKDGGRLSYRFVDTCIKNPGDIPICFEDLESGFAEIIEAEKEGRKPYLP